MKNRGARAWLLGGAVLAVCALAIAFLGFYTPPGGIHCDWFCSAPTPHGYTVGYVGTALFLVGMAALLYGVERTLTARPQGLGDPNQASGR